MAEYIKTTDAIITTWMILRGMGYAAEDNPDMVKTVSAVFDTAPAADVVEVIRCKDCKHAHMTDDGLCKYCDQLIENGVDEAIYFPGDYFCADGERKDG